MYSQNSEGLTNKRVHKMRNRYVKLYTEKSYRERVMMIEGVRKKETQHKDNID